AVDPNGDSNPILSEPEAAALWELAGLAGKPIGLRVLDEATRDPLAVGQLAARSEPALIVAIGLDPEKRDRAARLLAGRLRDPGLPLSQKAELAFTALELEDRPSPATEECATILAQAFAADPPGDLSFRWRRDHLSAVQDRLDPGTAARALAAALEQEKDANARSTLASDLAAV